MPDQVIGRSLIELIPKAQNFGRDAAAQVRQQMRGVASQVDQTQKQITQSVGRARDAQGRYVKQAADEQIKQTRRASRETQRETGRVTAGVSKSFNGMRVGIAESFSGLKGVVAGAFAGIAIGSFFKSAITAASDLGETVSKTKVVFGEAGDAVVAWSKTTAQAMGISQQEALDSASSLGVFGKAAGLSGQDLAKFGQALVARAADMASFSNTTPVEALEAIQAGLRGEAEPLRRYGVLLDDASLRQEALKQGLIRTTKEALTPQQKVLAAQSLILAQTSIAQGDFARTSGGLANQQRILSAQFADMKTSIGAIALPLMVKLFTFLNTTGIPAAKGIGKAFQAIPSEIKVGIGAFLGFSAAAAIAVAGIRKIVELAKSVKAALVGMSAAARATTLSLGAIGIVLGVAAGVYAHFAQKNAEAKQRVSDLKDTLNTATGAITENTKAFVANQLQQNGALDTAKKFGFNLAEVTQAALGNSTSMAAVNAQIDKAIVFNRAMADSLGTSGQEYRNNTDNLIKLKTTLNGSNTELDAAKARQQQLGEATSGTVTKTQAQVVVVDQAAAAYKRQKAASDALSAAFDRQLAVTQKLNADLSKQANLLLGMSGAQINYQAAVDNTTAAIAKNGRTHNLNTEAGRANQSALNDLAKAANDQREAMLNGGAGTVAAAKATEAARANFIKMATQMGYNSAAAKKMADDLIKIPNVTRTATLKANKKELEDKIAAAKRELDNPKGVTKARTAVLKADIRNAQAGIRDINSKLNALPKVKTVRVVYSAAGVTTWTAASTRGGGKQGGIGSGMATGGGIHGPGGPTGDKIPIMASDNEHMWTAKEVAAAGGHGAVKRMRKAVLKRAAGGAVRVNMIQQGVFRNIKQGTAYLDKLFASGGDSGPPGARHAYRGVTLNERTIRMLLAAERILRATFHITQGSYSTRVAASGSTHAGGGAMDTNGPRGWDTAVAALRKAGFASWHRTPSQGPWNHHIHSIAIGDPSASSAAKRQVADFKRGGDGLGSLPAASRNRHNTPSFQTGAWKVLKDQLAYLHKNEMVLPPAIGEYLRRRVRPPRLTAHQLHLQHLAHVAHQQHALRNGTAAGRLRSLLTDRPGTSVADTETGGDTGGGVMTVRLSDEDRKLLAALGDRPIEVELDAMRVDRVLGRRAVSGGRFVG